MDDSSSTKGSRSQVRNDPYYAPWKVTKAGSMTVENRLLHYLIAYVLVQRNKTPCSTNALLAYGIFISNDVEHVGIDTSNENLIAVNPWKHLIDDSLIHKMSIYKYDGV
ncbi:hypothetical protein Lal_00027033 [Lupinus albus]|nr:hypothetical protein Lal_00027033 [Lupinus albus]